MRGNATDVLDKDGNNDEIAWQVQRKFLECNQLLIGTRSGQREIVYVNPGNQSLKLIAEAFAV